MVFYIWVFSVYKKWIWRVCTEWFINLEVHDICQGNQENKYEVSLRKLTYLDKSFTRYYIEAGRGGGKGSHVPFELLSMRLFGKNLIMIP